MNNYDHLTDDDLAKLPRLPGEHIGGWPAVEMPDCVLILRPEGRIQIRKLEVVEGFRADIICRTPTEPPLSGGEPEKEPPPNL